MLQVATFLAVLTALAVPRDAYLQRIFTDGARARAHPRAPSSAASTTCCAPIPAEAVLARLCHEPAGLQPPVPRIVTRAAAHAGHPPAEPKHGYDAMPWDVSPYTGGEAAVRRGARRLLHSDA